MLDPFSAPLRNFHKKYAIFPLHRSVLAKDFPTLGELINCLISGPIKGGGPIKKKEKNVFIRHGDLFNKFIVSFKGSNSKSNLA